MRKIKQTEFGSPAEESAATPQPATENPKSLFAEIILGPAIEGCKMHEAEFNDTKTVSIREQNVNFRVAAGPEVFNDKVLKETYILEVYCLDAVKPGQFSFTELGLKANELASAFCEENGFKVSKHLKSWPKFQAIIYKSK